MRISTRDPNSGDILGTGEETALGIDAENMGIALQQLTSYQQPIASLVRELVSNALDAQLEAEAYSKLSWDQIISSGWTDYLQSRDQYQSLTEEEDGREAFKIENPFLAVEYAIEMERRFKDWQNRPVRVELIPQDDVIEEAARFRVTDFGVGISPERMKRIYAKFFSSTKRGTNRQIGAFGLGAKSPLGYTENFTIITRYNGIEYTYTIYISDRGPAIRPLAEEPTAEPNGTTVEVTLLEDKDYSTFLTSIRQQLAYFDNVEFVGFSIPEGRIVKGKTFFYRENSPFNGMHLVLGRVYYPIDFVALGLNSFDYQAPIGLYISMEEVGMHEEEGRVSIMHTREAVKYNKESIEVIKNRLEEAKAEITKLYQDKMSGISSMEDYYAALKDRKSKSLEIIDGVVITKLDSFVKIKAVYPKYAFLKKLPTELFFEWETVKEVRRGSATSKHIQKNIQEIVTREYDAYLLEPNINSSTKKNRYLYWLGKTFFYLIKRAKLTEEDILNKFGYSTSQESQTPTPDELIGIESFMRELGEFVESYFEFYSDQTPSPEFIEYEKDLKRSKATGLKGRIRKQGDEQFPIRYLSRKKGQWAWTTSYMTEGAADDDRYGTTIYGTQEDEDLLLEVASVIFRVAHYYPHPPNTGNSHHAELDFRKMRILKISRASKAMFAENPSAYDIKDFVDMNHKIIMRYMTGYLITVRALPFLPTLVHEKIGRVMPRVQKSAIILQAYISQYYRTEGIGYQGMSADLLDLFKAKEKERLIELAKWQKEVDRIKSLPVSVQQRRMPKKPTTLPLLDPDIMQHIERVRSVIKAFPLLSSMDLTKVDLAHLKQYLELQGKADPELVARLVNRK